MPPQRSRKRDPRIPVDEAMRATIERAGRVRLGEHDRRVLDAVLIATASYSLFSDETSTRQLAGWAYGVEPAEVQPEQRRRTAKSLKKLAALDVIGYSPGAGHYSRCIVSLMPKGVADVPLDQVQGGRFGKPRGSIPPSNGVGSVSPPTTTPGTYPTESAMLRALHPYECPLGRGCDNGRLWDEERQLSLECDCMRVRAGASA